MRGRVTNLRDESGQALVVTALVVPIMVGCIALAVDMGVLYHEKRNLQIAADAAALAGAVGLSLQRLKLFSKDRGRGGIEPKRLHRWHKRGDGHGQ